MGFGAQGGNAKAPARNNAPGGSTARATRAKGPAIRKTQRIANHYGDSNSLRGGL